MISTCDIVILDGDVVISGGDKVILSGDIVICDSPTHIRLKRNATG